MLRFLLVTLLVALSSQQQKDPLKDFCRRFGHQTAVVDRKLYIDGGLINYNPLDQNPLNYTNNGLLYADFDVNNQGMPQEYTNLSKPASAPSVAGGILWADTVNKMFYLYGGEFQISPQSFSMWAYDVLNDKWSSPTPDATAGGIQRASYGAGVAVQDIALGFYYGGWLSNASVPTWGADPVALSNLLIYDMIKNQWSNSTGPDSIGRAEGTMVYIPASDGGMLVYFGGIQTPYGNSTWEGVSMDKIFLYDIANQKWYTQTATGDVPDKRRRFCAGATWAQDQSSYNIYLYGGASMPPLTSGFDDVYILSIPSFTWIKWYPTAPGTAYPHHSLSCNVIDNAQMLVMGGTFPNSTACDAPAVYAFHNLDLGKQNSENAKWALFSPNKTTYKVPSEIVAAVGGSSTGGATLLAPQGGFSDRDLATYFQRIYKPASRSPTRAIPTPTNTPSVTPVPSSKKKNVAAIAGGAAAGGVVLLALAGALVFFCCVRRKPKTEASQTAHQPNHSQQDQGPVVEVRAESSRDRLPELPTIQSPGMRKVEHYAVSSASSLPSSAPHSPSQSPPPATHPYPFHHEVGSTAPPYGAPAFHYQQPYPPVQPYASQHPYPPVQQMYSAQTQYQMPPQHYPPPQQYHPPQPYPPIVPAASYPHSSQIYAHDQQPHPTASPEAPTNPVPRRQVGSIVSTSSIPGPAGDYIVESSALAGAGLPPMQGSPSVVDKDELEEHVPHKS